MNVEEFKSSNGHDVEGYWLPRVTSITGIISKPGLFRYYAMHRNFYSAQESMNSAAAWGNLVHTAVENTLKGKGDIDSRVQASVDGFLKWKEKNNVKILSVSDVEKSVYDLDDNYSGTVDAVLEIDGRIGILDIKTGASIWDEYSLQLAAYMNAYNKFVPKKRQANTRWILRIDQFDECEHCKAQRRIKSGRITAGDKMCPHHFSETKAKLQFKELKDYNRDIEGFLSAKRLWEWSNRKLLNEVENYPKNKNPQTLF